MLLFYDGTNSCVKAAAETPEKYGTGLSLHPLLLFIIIMAEATREAGKDVLQELVCTDDLVVKA